MNQQEHGKDICRDLENQKHKAEWFLDAFGELFLIVDSWLMRRIGNEEGVPVWVAVKQTFKSIIECQYTDQRKLKYIPIFT